MSTLWVTWEDSKLKWLLWAKARSQMMLSVSVFTRTRSTSISIASLLLSWTTSLITALILVRERTLVIWLYKMVSQIMRSITTYQVNSRRPIRQQTRKWPAVEWSPHKLQRPRSIHSNWITWRRDLTVCHLIKKLVSLLYLSCLMMLQQINSNKLR